MSGKSRTRGYVDTGALIGVEEYAYKSPPPFPYKIREMLSYAKKNGKKLSELSDKELARFKIEQ